MILQGRIMEYTLESIKEYGICQLKVIKCPWGRRHICDLANMIVTGFPTRNGIDVRPQEEEVHDYVDDL